MKTQPEIDWLHAVRDHEIAIALAEFPDRDDANVLEIGSGTGYMLSKLQARYKGARGLEVASSSYTYDNPAIQQYDGVSMPVDDESLDVVFSSHVLEHISDIDAFLSEIQRTLKPGGLSIHIIPSSTWRVLTSLMHYVSLVRRALSALGGKSGSSVREQAQGRSRGELLRYALYAPRHGERGNVISEIWFFSKRYWLSVFERVGLPSRTPISGRLVYWGNDVFREALGLPFRERLSRLLGPSSYIYVSRKAGVDSKTA